MTRLLLADAEVPHLNQEYCQQLEEHLPQEDHKKENKLEVRIVLYSSIWDILTTWLVAWSLHTSVAEHATNGVVKMTQIEDCKAILTFHFFSFL